VIKENDEDALNRFLSLYPEGDYSTQAKLRLAELQKTALWRAAAQGSVSTIERLLGAGADPSKALERGGATPLHFAAKGCKVDAVRLLLARGANVKVAADDGATALHWAAAAGCVDVVRLLLEGAADIKALVPDTVRGFVRMESGEYDKFGYDSPAPLPGTALHWAAEYGRLEVVGLLLERGADVNQTVAWGLAPLHNAARSGSEKTVSFLIERGARVFYPNLKNGQPIHWAKNASVARVLVANGASLGTASELHGLPIHNAAYMGYVDAITHYLDNGTPVEAIGRWNVGPTVWAIPVTPAWVAAYSGQLEAFKILESRGADLRFTTAPNRPGGTVLHAAAANGNEALLRHLLTRQLPIDSIADMPNGILFATPWEKVTPLQVAAWAGHPSAVKLLLQAGADVNAPSRGDRQDWNALTYALVGRHERGSRAHEEVATLLLTHGAKLTLSESTVRRLRTSDELKAQLAALLPAPAPAPAPK
jgi:ankyrin repeat protein